MATSRIEKTLLQTIGRHKNIKIALHKLDVRIGLILIMIIISLVVWLIFYCVSPYWYSRDMIRQLSKNNLATAEQAIPDVLLQPYKANLLNNHQLSPAQRQQPGAKYLEQVWPKVAEQQNLHQLLLLHFNSAPPDSIRYAYSHFPSRFRLTVGDTPQNTLWIEWQRQNWNNWQLSQLCLYNPQPVAEVNNCLSSSR